MNVQIRYPSITAAEPRQQLEEIRSYLYQLADQLNYILSRKEESHERQAL